MDDKDIAEKVEAEQKDEKYQKKYLESTFDVNYSKGEHQSLTGDDENDKDKSQVIFIISLSLLLLSIIMKLFNKNRI